jgi:hypothetical protein
MYGNGSPPPRIGSGDLFESAEILCLIPSVGIAHAARRKVTPLGISPLISKRHSAMSNLRAKATIMVLRVLPRASVVRARYHCANPLASLDWRS